jgi:hypothetical protein
MSYFLGVHIAYSVIEPVSTNPLTASPHAYSTSHVEVVDHHIKLCPIFDNSVPDDNITSSSYLATFGATVHEAQFAS